MSRKEYNAAYYQRNREKLLAQSKVYHANHKEEINKNSKLYRQTNKEKLKKSQKESYAKNREDRLLRQKQYLSENADAIARRRRASIAYQIAKLRSGAVSRGISIEISGEKHMELIQLDCVYCGSPKPSDGFNGIDREDNDIGYTHENSKPCCWNCNRMKGTLTREEFLAQCRKVAMMHQ